jgi:hypothetical protein
MHRFTFNLLPQKSQEEVERAEKRDSNAITLALLPLMAVVVAIAVMLFNNLFMDERIEELNQEISRQENSIESYRQVVTKNAEFVRKSEILVEPIERDVEPERFFSLSDEILGELRFPTSIQSYGRSNDGSFEIRLSFEELVNIISVLTEFESSQEVQQTNTDALSHNVNNDSVNVTINFFLVDDEDEGEENG